ncbi:MAG: YggS family pyridoxal phosphate-dependent enzyme [Clostridia bacterium]|nr:YggS family pyridoxal phosphate-dependent enzyme [Clostridia bacterium]
MTEKLSVEQRFDTIEANLAFIRSEIADAAKKSGRTPDEIHLMAVTKTVEPIFINHALSCGVDLIGENKVQELLSKEPFLNLEGVDVHLIGHLQTNKVRQILPHVSTIQSVDSIKLAREIAKQAEKIEKDIQCLIEVNVGDEESKTGIPMQDVSALLEEMAQLPRVKVKGLMAIPPICEEPILLQYFEKMREMFVDIQAKKMDNINMDILSMGMSSDYKLAILHGATMVRVGSSIFGPRLY